MIGGTSTKVELKQESTTQVKGSDTNPMPNAPKAATTSAPAPANNATPATTGGPGK